MGRWGCLSCGSIYEQRFACCTVCLETGVIVPLPDRDKVIFERPGREGVKSLAELRKRKQEGHCIEGFEFLGRLPSAFKALVFGLPGSGKSTFVLLLANSFTGNTLYASVEEGFSDSFLHKLATWEIANQGIKISDCKTSREIKIDLEKGKYDLVVIDSISQMGEVPELPGYSQIWIAHSCKDGSYKGDSDLAHNVDLVVKCEAGVAMTVKNRFAPLAEMRIFEGREND